MRNEMSNIFEVIHVSAETGFVKPEPAGFKTSRTLLVSILRSWYL
jgi:hypothetical protein